MRRLGRLGLIALGVLGAVGVAAPASARAVHPQRAVASTAKAEVAVFGDSLITQAESALAAGLPNAAVQQDSFPGFAACSYLGTVKSYLKSHHPRVAILEFWGNDNSATPCMTAPMQSPGYFAEYKADLTQMTKEFVDNGAHVFIVGTIPDAAEVANKDTLWDHLNDLYSAIADTYRKRVVSFVNVQTILESKGDFTWYLPCLESESSCDAPVASIVSPPPAGSNVVRSDDGLHFCPLLPQTSNLFYNFVHCDAYASGTTRYASFLVEAVEEFLRHHVAPRFIGSPLPPAGSVPMGIPGQIDPYTGTVYPQPAS